MSVCPYDPIQDMNIGMFHCPLCGEMQMGGLPHLPSIEDLIPCPKCSIIYNKDCPDCCGTGVVFP